MKALSKRTRQIRIDLKALAFHLAPPGRKFSISLECTHCGVRFVWPSSCSPLYPEDITESKPEASLKFCPGCGGEIKYGDDW